MHGNDYIPCKCIGLLTRCAMLPERLPYIVGRRAWVYRTCMWHHDACGSGMIAHECRGLPMRAHLSDACKRVRVPTCVHPAPPPPHPHPYHTTYGPLKSAF